MRPYREIMPPDFGNANILLGIIGAGAALVLFFYTYQIWWKPIIDRFLSTGTKSADELAADLLVKYHEENKKLDGPQRAAKAISPRLQMLRAAVHEEGLRCLLVNQGGRATDLRIASAGGEGRIEPEAVLENGQTGSLSFSQLRTPPTSMQFQLSYRDSLGLEVVRTYAYSESDKTFVEI